MVEIRNTDLVHSVIESGRNKGLHQYELMGQNADKMMKLSLGAKTSVRDETGLHIIIEDPEDKHLSTYALLHGMLTRHLPVDYKLQVFLKKIPGKEIARQRALLGDLAEAWWNNNPKHPFKAIGKIGKNQPTHIFCAITFRCKFSNPDKFMARSAHPTGRDYSGREGHGSQNPCREKLTSKYCNQPSLSRPQ
jgi:hypothetical protein